MVPRIAVVCVLAVLQCAAAASFRAAAVQFEVIAGSSPADTLQQSLMAFRALAQQAAAEHAADVVVFPEFGLFGGNMTQHCKSPTTPSPYCQPVPYAVGDVPCVAAASSTSTSTSTSTSSSSSVAVASSCTARNASITTSVNMCEVADGVNYNTQLVFGADGGLVAKYRKSHPWFTSCFHTPPTTEVTFNATFRDGATATFGVFTCKDILYSAPGPVMAKAGVKQFLYSVAVPLVGADAVALWSLRYKATMVSSDLDMGQSGVFVRGKRLSDKPPSHGSAIVWADVSV